MAKIDVKNITEKAVIDRLYRHVDPEEYSLFDNAVFSRAGELRPYSFLCDLVEPFIGRTEIVEAKGQVRFNNGPNAYSPILDLLCQGADIRLGVEMQEEGDFPPPRALAYISNIVVPNVPKGVHLSSHGGVVRDLPKRWVLLVFCNFHPFGRDDRAVHRFSCKGDGSNRAFGDGVSYVYVDCKSAHLNKRQKRVIHDLMATRLEDMTIQSFKDALCYARGENHTIEKRRRTIMMSFKEYEGIVFDEGKNVGVAIGKAEGKTEKEAEVAKNMALRGFTVSDIAIALGMSEAEVLAILPKTA